MSSRQFPFRNNDFIYIQVYTSTFAVVTLRLVSLSWENQVTQTRCVFYVTGLFGSGWSASAATATMAEPKKEESKTLQNSNRWQAWTLKRT